MPACGCDDAPRTNGTGHAHRGVRKLSCGTWKGAAGGGLGVRGCVVQGQGRAGQVWPQLLGRGQQLRLLSLTAWGPRARLEDGPLGAQPALPVQDRLAGGQTAPGAGSRWRPARGGSDPGPSSCVGRWPHSWHQPPVEGWACPPQRLHSLSQVAWGQSRGGVAAAAPSSAGAIPEAPPCGPCPWGQGPHVGTAALDAVRLA